MARIFITGSSDGLGLMAARLLLDQGHKIVLHARSQNRASELRAKVAGVGAEPRHTRTPNCMTFCWRSRWRGYGLMFFRTRSNLAGCRRKWEDHAHRMIWIRGTEPKFG